MIMLLIIVIAATAGAMDFSERKHALGLDDGISYRWIFMKHMGAAIKLTAGYYKNSNILYQVTDDYYQSRYSDIDTKDSLTDNSVTESRRFSIGPRIEVFYRLIPKPRLLCNIYGIIGYDWYDTESSRENKIYEGLYPGENMDKQEVDQFIGELGFSPGVYLFERISLEIKIGWGVKWKRYKNNSNYNYNEQRNVRDHYESSSEFYIRTTGINLISDLKFYYYF
jgi:hypothetical protein